jgi:hypothetical protein
VQIRARDRTKEDAENMQVEYLERGKDLGQEQLKLPEDGI